MNVAESGIVLSCVIGAKPYGWVRNEMLIWGVIHLSLDCHALGGHAVERRLIDFDCSFCSIWLVWIHCDDSHWVDGVVSELV